MYIPKDTSTADVALAPTPVKPFIKWAGGKRNLLAQYRPYLPARARIRRYFEPFLGGGAVFFSLQIQPAFLFDTNSWLIETYQVVRDQVEDLIVTLQQHQSDKAYYYHIRAQDPKELTRIERAARFIYLNRTCYNGLYRVNSRGQFNVPFGRYKNPIICDTRNLRAASRALQGTKLEVADFEHVANLAEPGDLVYFDPPYAPLSTTANFTGYTKDGFSQKDQERLAALFHRLHEQGCFVMLSNSSAPVIYDLYQGSGYNVIEIKARRAINSVPGKRGRVRELLITNVVLQILLMLLLL